MGPAASQTQNYDLSDASDRGLRRMVTQNMGHDDVLTTFSSYGTVPAGRQMELMSRFRKSGVHADDNDLIE